MGNKLTSNDRNIIYNIYPMDWLILVLHSKFILFLKLLEFVFWTFTLRVRLSVNTYYMSKKS